MKYIKYIIQISLVISLLCNGLPFIEQGTTRVAAQSSPFAGGDGSKENPYQIATSAQLRALDGEAKAKRTTGKYYELIKDIDVGDALWEPIGQRGASFEGRFNGNGYSISNITFTKTGDYSDDNGYFGLFEELINAEVYNLALRNIKISPENPVSSRCHAGGVLSPTVKKTTISNIQIRDVQGIDCSNQALLVNFVEDSTITHISYEGEVSSNAIFIDFLENTTCQWFYSKQEVKFDSGNPYSVNNVIEHIYSESKRPTLSELPVGHWSLVSDDGATKMQLNLLSTRLSSLSLSSYPNAIQYEEGKRNYSLLLLEAKPSFVLNYTKVDPAAEETLYVDGQQTARGTEIIGTDHVLSLVIKTKNNQTRTYAIEMRAVSRDATMSDLTVTGGTWSKGWDPTATEQQLLVDETATSLTIKPNVNRYATVKLDQQPLDAAKGYTFTKIPASFQLAVVAEDGQTTKTYTIQVKKISSNRQLQALTLTNATLSTPFQPLTTSYSATVSAQATTVQLSATAASERATLLLNGQPFRSGETRDIALDASGKANVTITVQAENGETATYTIQLARTIVKESNANLTSLRLAQASLSPAFSPTVKSYTAVVDYAVTNVDVLAVPASARARVNVTKQPLREGNNTVIVTVTAEDGTVNSYTITVVRLGLPIIVTPVEPIVPIVPPQPQPNRVINPSFTNGVALNVVRKVENGVKIDEIVLTQVEAAAMVNESRRLNRTVITLPFTEDLQNRADRVRFDIAPSVVTTWRSYDVAFQTPKGAVQVPATVLQNYVNGMKLVFDVTLPSSIADKALQTALPGATVVAAPVDIQYGALGKVKVTVPVSPTADPTALRFFIQHSQGDNELVRGEVNYNANRLPESLSVWVDRFSIFTVVADPYANVTASIKGEAKEGMTLQAVLSKDVPAAKYQWYRGTTAINGATKSTYTATAEDANATLTVAITLPNGETLKQSTAVVKAKTCLEKATFGCVTPKSAATVYELVNGVAVATTKQVTNATVAQAYLPAAYLLSPDGQWIEQVAGMKYTAISPALVARANSGKLVSWQKQLVMKGQIGMVTTTKPQPLFTNGTQRVGYVQMKQNYRVFGTRQALYQIGVNEFVLASDVEFQGK